MRIEILCEGATPAQLRAARLAANRALLVADVTVLAAWAVRGRWHEWEDQGRELGAEFSEDELRALQALQAAEDAANLAIGRRLPHMRAVLDLVSD